MNNTNIGDNLDLVIGKGKPYANNPPPQSQVRSIIPAIKHKLVSIPSLHIETPELSLNEELPEKTANLDVEFVHLK